MYTSPVQLSEVRYNAASQSYEASVTVHDAQMRRTYACAINAPLSMSFEDASKGLAKQALRRHQHRGGLHSQTTLLRPAQRAGRPTVKTVSWFEALLSRPYQTAA